MKPAEPEPQLSAEEKAFTAALRARVRPAAAPVNFARSLRSSGPPVVPFAGVAARPAARFRQLAVGMAAAAAVVLGWLFLISPQSAPREIAGAEKLPDTVIQTANEPSAPQTSPARPADPPAPAIHRDQLFSVREVALIRRMDGLPPVQLIAINGIRVRPEGASRRVEIESRLVPVVLKYH